MLSGRDSRDNVQGIQGSNPMSIFDRFKAAAPSTTKAAAEMKIEFTEEESAAINASMDEYASIWASTHAPAAAISRLSRFTMG
jgi:hypothetical protein